MKNAFVCLAFAYSALTTFGQAEYTKTLLAGSNFKGHLDGVGDKRMFNTPTAIIADENGQVFI